MKKLRAKESDETQKMQPGLAATFEIITFAIKEDLALLKYNKARDLADKITSRFEVDAKIPATFGSHPLKLAAICADVLRGHLREALQ